MFDKFTSSLSQAGANLSQRFLQTRAMVGDFMGKRLEVGRKGAERVKGLTESPVLEKVGRKVGEFGENLRGLGERTEEVKTRDIAPLGLAKKAVSLPLTYAGSTLAEVGRTTEKLATKRGREELTKGIPKVPSEIKTGFETGNFEDFFNNPAVVAGFALADIIPSGGGKTKIAETGLKTATKVVKGKNILVRGLEKLGDFLGNFKVLDPNIIETRGIVERLPSGKILSKKIDQIFDTFQVTENQAFRKFRSSTKNVADDVFEEALNFREGIITEASPLAQKVARQLDDIFEPFARKAEEVGLTIRNATGKRLPWQPRENYVPHVLDIEKLKANRDLAITHLTQTGQLEAEAATKMIDEIIAGREPFQAFNLYKPQTLPRLQSNLEFARVFDFPKEVLDRTKNVVVKYIRGASKRLAQAEVLGPKNEVLEELLGGVARESPDQLKMIKDVTLRELGLAERNLLEEKTTGTARAFQAIVKLPFAAISNLTQVVNPITSYGIGPTTKAFIREIVPSMRRDSRDFAEIAGVIAEASIREIIEESFGKGGKIISKLTAPGFKQAEVFLRSFSANTGKFYIIGEFQKALRGNVQAIKNLKKMGVNVKLALKNGSLAEDDFITAARKAVKTTQFTVRPWDLPPNWTTNYGRLITQFKNFSFKQGQFIAREVITPAIKERRFGPLVRYIVFATIAGELAGDVKSFLTGRKRPTEPFQRAIDDILQAGGVGYAADLVRAAEFGTEGILEWIVGPTVSDIAEKGSAVYQAATKGKFKPLGRELVETLPFVGPKLKRTFFPTGEGNVIKTKETKAGIIPRTGF